MKKNQRTIRFLSCIALAAVAAGCAAPTTQRVHVSDAQTDAEARKQLDLAAEEVFTENTRVQRIHWQLVSRGAALCPKQGAGFGIYSLVREKSPVGEAIARLYKVGDHPTVVAVFDGGPAQKAGLQPGDQILSVQGVDIKDAAGLGERLQATSPGQAVSITVRRNGDPVRVAVIPAPVCPYPVSVSDQPILNAFADGERVTVTHGMVGFARTDEELALVLSHEIAHNAMKHMESKRQNAASGLVADVALAVLTRGAYRQSAISQAAAGAYSQEFEAEADYVGLYIMANAGYGIQEAPKFWRRMAAANPGNIKGSHSASHPSTSYRMVALEEAVKEIDAKRVANVALAPNLKDGKPAAPSGTVTAGGDPGTPRSSLK